MVLDTTTGRQHFMVPAGGNAMTDPATGQRHELTSPPPQEQEVQDREQLSYQQTCMAAARVRDAALANPNRTINSTRAAEARYARTCP